ncbi:hypothetical protein WJX84_004072 [Apatococcus fuscideae]|uniref:Uncharacterized protein n=1 Tax=Apatococcus fuscideae TaxID=2026836 RepID=A0AAW1SP91_9CHLO
MGPLVRSEHSSRRGQRSATRLSEQVHAFTKSSVNKLCSAQALTPQLIDITMSVPSSIHDPGAPDILSGKDSNVSEGSGEVSGGAAKPDQGGHINATDASGTTKGSSPESIGKTMDAGKAEDGTFPAAASSSK